MKKRTFSLLLSIAMLVSLLAGFSGQASGAAASNNEKSTLPADDETKEITISYWMFADDYKHFSSLNESPIVKVLNEKFNVKLDFQTPAMGSEADNFNLMLGTQDYTDIMNMTYCTESLSTLYEDGVILDLAPYVEEYMPNYYAVLQANPELKRAVYDDDGHLFTIPQMANTEALQWGGMVYRRDILETMTGGNVQFPSGNDEPTTVEDWDYMLPLMKAYFEASGMVDTACLIIPATGYVGTGELQAGWGATGMFGLGTDGKTVEYAPATDNFYNYVCKMHEWYEAGFIYPDFASRTSDMFYLPNPALTYGGAAGVWFGLLAQVSDRMSMPEYGLNMDVRPLSAPLDTAHGVTPEMAGSYISTDIVSANRCIAATVSPEKLVRILKVMDYTYTQECALMMYRGLNAEQAAKDELYTKMGFTDGAYWYDENGKICVADWYLHAEEQGITRVAFTAERLMGVTDETCNDWPANKEHTYLDDAEENADAVWTAYGSSRVIPMSAANMNSEESEKYNAVYTDVNDYANTMIPKFILGTEPLNEETWAAFVQKLNDLGMQDMVDARQSAYDRYMAR